MRALRVLAIALCVVSAAALALCLLTEGHDAVGLPLALGSAAAANIIDRCAEKQSQRGECHE